MPSCWACGTGLPFVRYAAVPREAECPKCGRDLHACRNCRHYDPGVNNKCREPNAEWVTDRERANFCEFFQLTEAPLGGGGQDRSIEARKKLEDLFRQDP